MMDGKSKGRELGMGMVGVNVERRMVVVFLGGVVIINEYGC